MNVINFLAYIKRDFKRTDKDTEILQAYNDSILDVSTRIPHNGYKYQSWLPLIERQEDYPYPGATMHLLHPLRLLEGNGANDTGWPLNLISKAEYDIRYPNPNRTDSVDTGIPKDYCCYGGGFLVGPVPDSVAGGGYILETSWCKIPVDLSGDSDIPALEDSWREVLKWMTLERLYSGMEIFQTAAFYKAKYEDSVGEPIGLLRRLINIEDSKETVVIEKMDVNTL